MNISRRLILLFIVLTILFSLGFALTSSKEDYYTDFPDAEYDVEAEVLGSNTVRFTNTSNKPIYELSITGDSININNSESINCADANKFEICLLKDILLPGENYLLSIDSSANGRINYFAKDTFDSIVVTKSF